MSTALELRMYQDAYPTGASLTMPLKAAHRIIYVFKGGLTAFGDKALAVDEALYGKAALPLVAGDDGAEVWRWEIAEAASDLSLASGDGVVSALMLSGPLDTVEVEAPDEGWLLRLDSVAFPAGGCALTHTHRGPGIRCLVTGDIRIDADGASHGYGVGAPWYESGPDPVFAQAGEAATRFVRVSVLPARLLGASSIRYVNAEDAAKPKDQTYRGYIDQDIGRP